MDKERKDICITALLIFLITAAIPMILFALLDQSSSLIAITSVLIGLICALPYLVWKERKYFSSSGQKPETPGSELHMRKYGATSSLKAKHMAGLPIAEGAECFVYLCSSKIIFFRNETEYSLLFDKVTDVLVKTDSEIHQAYVSSIGGAVGGAVLFGPLGAMIGGRAKKKESKTFKYYLIFEYDKDEGVDFISFEIQNQISANSFVKAFSQKEKIKKTIEL